MKTLSRSESVSGACVGSDRDRTNLGPGEGALPSIHTYVAVDLTLLCKVMQDVIMIVSQTGSLLSE
jgi:hypothetical protein